MNPRITIAISMNEAIMSEEPMDFIVKQLETAGAPIRCLRLPVRNADDLDFTGRIKVWCDAENPFIRYFSWMKEDDEIVYDHV